jgi:hypothetical protein
MARIRTSRSVNVTHIKISGRLTAADMGRFERACGPALTTHALALVIDVSDVTEADRTAEALMHRLEARGARIIHAFGRSQ